MAKPHRSGRPPQAATSDQPHQVVNQRSRTWWSRLGIRTPDLRITSPSGAVSSSLAERGSVRLLVAKTVGISVAGCRSGCQRRHA